MRRIRKSTGILLPRINTTKTKCFVLPPTSAPHGIQQRNKVLSTCPLHTTIVGVGKRGAY